MLLHLLLRCHMAHCLLTRHAACHTLAAHLRLHHATWMLSAHSSRTQAMRAGLHAHHSARLADMRRTRNTRMHLHRLTHVAGRRCHAWMSMGQTWMPDSRRWLVCCHHLAARCLVRAARWQVEDQDSPAGSRIAVSGSSRRPVEGRTAVSRAGAKCIGRYCAYSCSCIGQNDHVLWSAPAAGKRNAELAESPEARYAAGTTCLGGVAVQCSVKTGAIVSIDAGRELIQDGSPAQLGRD